MKKVFLLCISLCGLCSVALAQKSPAVALDTIREFYADSTLSRLYTVQKGTDIREGLSLSYHPDGKVAIEAPYKNGKLDGVFKSYFANGKLWQTIGYKNGIEEGISTTYFDNGTKKSKEVYRGGILDGLTEEWDDQGKLRRKLPYMRGQLHGVAKVFDDLGGLKEEMTFDKGLREGPYRRYNRGVKVLEAEFQQNRCVKNCDF
ncbi:toxin-antitoxin system YwqK family antitoxin [uncultured Fibrobacter sp.]|uniref:toxin-antitoxin system YwqK family antitoxin n=1 Tax=uncultured Fibrobacter sp. TaxID=261512 RepID=UPI0026379EA4|nr:toxin-antitoxin system YwqK family antitoxin [uncultured Fibrobacter sp.]